MYHQTLQMIAAPSQWAIMTATWLAVTLNAKWERLHVFVQVASCVLPNQEQAVDGPTWSCHIVRVLLEVWPPYTSFISTQLPQSFSAHQHQQLDKKIWGSGKVLNIWKKIWHQICWSEISEKFWYQNFFRNSELFRSSEFKSEFFRSSDLWSDYFQMFRFFIKLLMNPHANVDSWPWVSLSFKSSMTNSD